ncbi:S-adenosyl-L-methionine-dependent methyltransferase [Gigaspora margarita]|uniref:S-adenosyl-L-methionine-dependent methyltransferase n=1 Tax=Gigaspora margarita TaxID=4874 RepID=A0A8H4AW48_GIGMA|nr:S-adenosyl-L-methionine-dependent methyltransferase [Gigaspora margarita]
MGCFVSKKKGLIDDTLEISRTNEKYPFPRRNNTWDRLTLQHYLFRYIWQSNFSSPVQESIKNENVKILDVGSGSGPWALEMAGEFPNALFTRLDSSKTSHQNSTTLPNLIIKDYDFSKLEPLPFKDSTFDFIHVGFLASELPEKQFQTLVNELARTLKPGGYLEIMDVDFQGGNEGPSAQRLMSSLRSYYLSRDINPLITQKLEPIMKSTKCLDNVTGQKTLHPLGDWDEKIGELALFSWLQMLNDLKPVMAPFMGISDSEYRNLIQEFKHEVDIFQTYWISTRVYGRKIQ